jgi:predicted Ser/Thr protein kinase
MRWGRMIGGRRGLWGNVVPPPRNYLTHNYRNQMIKFGFDKETVKKYTGGSCGHLALALHHLFKLPIYGVVSKIEEPSIFHPDRKPIPYHYAVKMGDHYIDVTGYYNKKEILTVVHTFLSEDITETLDQIHLVKVSPDDLDNPDYLEDLQFENALNYDPVFEPSVVLAMKIMMLLKQHGIEPTYRDPLLTSILKTTDIGQKYVVSRSPLEESIVCLAWDGQSIKILKVTREDRVVCETPKTVLSVYQKMSQLGVHPPIYEFGSLPENNGFYMIMQRATKSLANDPIYEQFKKEIKEIIKYKVTTMHKNDIAHGDLHTDNIVYVLNPFDVFIIDFDTSFLISTGKHNPRVQQWMTNGFGWDQSYEDFVAYDYENYKGTLV